MNQPIAIAAVTHLEHGAATKRANIFTRFAPTAARVWMGLLFSFAGLNGLLQFLPPPPPGAMPAGAMALTIAFAKSGYLIPLVGATQAVVGALLLANRFVPLALTILAPVVVQIVAFHAFLAPQGLPVALVVLSLEIYLAVVHGKAFRSLLVARS